MFRLQSDYRQRHVRMPAWREERTAWRTKPDQQQERPHTWRANRSPIRSVDRRWTNPRCAQRIGTRYRRHELACAPSRAASGGCWRCPCDRRNRTSAELETFEKLSESLGLEHLSPHTRKHPLSLVLASLAPSCLNFFMSCIAASKGSWEEATATTVTSP